MWFERIEREISDGEPWAEFLVNRMEWGGETRDCCEVNSSSKKQPSRRWLQRPKFKFWHSISWIKIKIR